MSIEVKGFRNPELTERKKYHSFFKKGLYSTTKEKVIKDREKHERLLGMYPNSKIKDDTIPPAGQFVLITVDQDPHDRFLRLHLTDGNHQYLDCPYIEFEDNQWGNYIPYEYLDEIYDTIYTARKEIEDEQDSMNSFFDTKMDNLTEQIARLETDIDDKNKVHNRTELFLILSIVLILLFFI